MALVEGDAQHRDDRPKAVNNELFQQASFIIHLCFMTSIKSHNMTILRLCKIMLAVQDLQP